jgi:hypothetical protein
VLTLLSAGSESLSAADRRRGRVGDWEERRSSSSINGSWLGRWWSNRVGVLERPRALLKSREKGGASQGKISPVNEAAVRACLKTV